MPFFHGSVEDYAEVMRALNGPETLVDLAEDSSPEDFRYIDGIGQFDPDQLGPVARLILRKLRVIGATHFYVRYDGGLDSGFAHSDHVLFGNEGRNLIDVLREIGTVELREQIRSEARKESRWGNALELYANASPVETAQYALDELALELTGDLLGNDFGEGNYVLYGAFTADLEACQLIDDPNAQKPDHME